MLKLLNLLGIALLAILMSGCAMLHTHTSPQPPEAFTVVRGKLIVHSDFALDAEHRLFDVMEALRWRMSDELSLTTSDRSIHVYVFKTQRRFRGFMRAHYPEFVDRRAVFVREDDRLSVYSWWGDRAAEDFRHELAHGYLHAMITDVPLWLDEGIAESFEVRQEDRGLNRHNLDLLVDAMKEDNWQPGLSRISSIEKVSEMGPLDYAEAWAWVHFLLNSTPANRDLIRNHLQRMQKGESSASLATKIQESIPEAARELVSHLEEQSRPTVP